MSSRKRGRPRKTEEDRNNDIDSTENENGSFNNHEASLNDCSNLQKSLNDSTKSRKSMSTENGLPANAPTTRYSIRVKSMQSLRNVPCNIEDEKKGEGNKSDKSDKELNDDKSNERNCSTESKRSRGKTRRRGRGRRGRPRGRAFSSEDYNYAYTPAHPITHTIDHNILVPVVKLETVEVEANKEEHVVRTVTCAKCETSMSRSNWNHHNLWKHNNLAWREGDAQVDYNSDPKLLNKVLSDAIKKRDNHLACELCGTTKKSVMGFVSHLTFCGKTDEEKQSLLVACEICRAQLMPVSMITHMKAHQNKETKVARKHAEVEPQIEKGDQEVVIPERKSRRRAAEKAVSRISEFASTVIKEELIIEHKPNPQRLRKLVQRPQVSKRVPGIVKKVWIREVADGGEAKCKQPGCAYTSPDVTVIEEHYLTCNFIPRKNFVCKICLFESSLESVINAHVTSQHSGEDLGESFSASENEASESEEDEIDETDAVITFSQPKRRVSSQSRFEKTINVVRWSFMKNFNQKMVYHHTLKWTLDFEMENYRINLFQDLQPNEFQALTDEQAKIYMPKEENSMKTTVQRYDELSKNVETEWKSWQRFEGDIDSNVPTFFCGGPIWALAWLPIPSSLYAQDVEQFLAVSTHIDMETEYGVDQTYSGCNCIQLWNIGVLDLQLAKINVPQLAYAITHNHGTIWCMEWCPSGCYEDERLYNYESSESRPRRIGLLASAFSDGCIRIYSMVFPEELHNAKSEQQEFPFYQTKPVRTLVLDYDSYNNDQQSWQCMKLSWTKEAGHDVIIAGFSNGYIALWDIATESSLMVVKTSDGSTFLDPFQKFHAHTHCVTMINIVSYANKRYCVSASLDRHLKMWDLEDTSAPISKAKHGVIVDGVWMNHWPCAAVTFDNAMGLNASGSYVLPIREFEFKHFQLLNAGCTIYSIGVNDFVNGISEGTVAGDVYAMFPPQFVYLKDLESVFTKTRFLCSTITVVDFDSNDEKINLKGDRKKKKKGDDYHYLPSTYAGCKDRFGLIYTDEVRFTCRKKSQKILAADTNHPINVEQYPFTSVNRLSWNPNSWSHLWLACAYQNGLVRLFNFKSLSMPQQLNGILNQHSTAFLKKAEDVRLAQCLN